jgi:hypothetical protein
MYDYRRARDWVFGLRREGDRVIGPFETTTTARERLLLLALIEFAPNIAPALGTLAAMTKTDVRTVRRLLRSCELKGLLRVELRPGANSRYVLTLDPGLTVTPGTAPSHPGHSAPPDCTPPLALCPPSPGTAPGLPRAQRPPKQTTEAVNKADNGISRAARLPKPKRAATPRPETWTPTDAHRAYAKQHGLDLDHQAHLFQSHHDSKGNLFVNWNAAFSTWLANALSFGPRNGPRRAVAPVQRGLAPGLDAATMGKPDWMNGGDE